MNPLGGPLLAVAAVVILGAVATFSLGVEPVVAARLGAQRGLPPHAVARILSVELGATMVAALPALLWNRRLAPRAVALGACLLFLMANLLSASMPAYGLLLVSRALSGLAGGTVLIVVLSAAARCAIPGRVYAAWVIGQTLASAVGLYMLPYLFTVFGLAGVYKLLAVATVIALPLTRGLAADDYSVSTCSVPVAPRASAAAATTLAVMFLFYVSVGGIWAFAADRGVEAGLDPARVATALAIASFVGIAGAALAAAIVRYGHSVRCLLIGHATLACGLTLFATASGATGFACAAVLLQLAWSFAAPFLLARVATCGSPAPMMSAANVTLGAGLTAGPLLAATLLERPGHFVLAIGVALALLGMGALLLIFGPRPPGQDVPALLAHGDAAS